MIGYFKNLDSLFKHINLQQMSFTNGDNLKKKNKNGGSPQFRQNKDFPQIASIYSAIKSFIQTIYFSQHLSLK